MSGTVRASGVGSMPGGTVGGSTAEGGENARDFAEAVRIVLGELDLPHLPELPGRGAIADLTGRGAAVLADAGVGLDLQPAGWRVTGSGEVGLDQRRARSLLGQDLDTFEDQAQGMSGPVKAQVVGPWTLAATTERPRGDRMLADHGARRDLAQGLAEAVRLHVEDLRRRLPGADLLLQIDEPALPAVLAGTVPTASGFGRHRTVHPPEAAEALGWVLSAVVDAGATPLVHCCAADVPVGLLADAGAQGVSVDLHVLAPTSYDDMAALVEADAWVLLGVVPSTDPVGGQGDRAGSGLAHRFFDMLALDPTDHTVLTPACGLAGASPAWTRRALELARAAARSLGSADEPTG